MRKIFVIMSLVLAIAMIAGCVPQTPEVPAAVEELNPLEGKTFYWLAANISDPFYVPGLEGWKAAAEELGVNVQFVGSLDGIGVAEQIKTFEQLNADSDNAGIFYYAVDYNASEPLIKEAEEKGITVIVGNTDSPYKTRSGFVGTDQAQMGQAAAGYVAELLKCEGSVGTIGNFGPGVTLRMQAFMDQVKILCPNITVYDQAIHEGSASSALATVDAYMVAHPDLSLLWFADGTSNATIGPWKERIEAGTKTMFLGCDMPPAALEAVKDGTWVGTIGQDTYAEEYWGLQMMVAKALGKSIPDTIYVASLVVTQENVDNYIE